MFIGSTSEGIVFVAGMNHIYENDIHYYGGTDPYIDNSIGDIQRPKISILITYNGTTIEK